jgi:rhamnosyltransferase
LDSAKARSAIFRLLRGQSFAMNHPFVSIIVRSFNEGWALRDTLAAVRAQEFRPWELIVFDSGSTDGSVDLIRQAQPRCFVQLAPEEYKPGKVLNHAMRLAAGAFGVFLNADATPQGSDWLGPLVNALRDPQTAAVFSRQIPRPDCAAVFACDYARCFGPKRASARWDHFFSLVSSGLRKDVWRRRGFLEHLQDAEDDEYTRWCRAAGYRVAYCPESVVMHSHNYTPEQAYRRSFGDTRAIARCAQTEPLETQWLRTVLLGWLNDLRRDLWFCVKTKRWREWPAAARIRWWQRAGKHHGARVGWNEAAGSPAQAERLSISAPR